MFVCGVEHPFKDINNIYSGRLGFNMYKLPEGEYTICIEFFPITMNNVSVDVVSTSLNINQQNNFLTIQDQLFICINGVFHHLSIYIWI